MSKTKKNVFTKAQSTEIMSMMAKVMEGVLNPPTSQETAQTEGDHTVNENETIAAVDQGVTKLINKIADTGGTIITTVGQYRSKTRCKEAKAIETLLNVKKNYTRKLGDNW